MKKATYKFGLKCIKEQDKKAKEAALNILQDSANSWRVENESTKTYINKFKAGEITENELKQHAYNRAIKAIEKRTNNYFQQLEDMKNAPELKSIEIEVFWAKNSTWGANPHAEIAVSTTSGYSVEKSSSISGCGYDKRSTATAEALNKNYSVLAALLDLARIQAKNPERRLNGFHTYYLPYFEGGCGFSCHQHIIEAFGLKSKCLNERAQNYDYYMFEKEA